jgi:hypothetical protein
LFFYTFTLCFLFLVVANWVFDPKFLGQRISFITGPISFA